ncbi:MAG: hypothetical protein EAX96_06075 [Candidatus Lokiarchaeota archaeon]|nr:hypothetical protein [Candidatus Lokiarchaeota archaeon]
MQTSMYKFMMCTGCLKPEIDENALETPCIIIVNKDLLEFASPKCVIDGKTEIKNSLKEL